MVDSESTQTNNLYIDGTWEEGNDTIVVSDLATDGTAGRIAAASQQQADDALAAAAEAQPAMAETTAVERAQWLEAIADAVEARAEEFTDTIVREAGKPISSARGAPAA
ncbi:MAG: NAD-dependent aldehyde dehydrogenase, partial [Halonotius sp. J07HN4]